MCNTTGCIFCLFNEYYRNHRFALKHKRSYLFYAIFTWAVMEIYNPLCYHWQPGIKEWPEAYAYELMLP